MKNKKVRLLLATITTIAMILGCLVVASGEVSEAASKKLTVSCKKTVAVNCTTTIKTNVKAKFKSSNKKIATVSSKGVVKGKKAGKVKITVTSKSNKKNKKTVTITVKNQLVITAPSGSKATLYVGETTKIKANLSSKFKSSNTGVATVSSSGKVVAKKAGTAKITVTSKSNKKLKKTVKITVKEKPEEKTETTTENKTTENNTTESNTTESNTTESNTTENNTTESNTTEDNTTEDNTTEDPNPERKIVGITAKCKGDKIPNGFVLDKFGIEVKAQYSDGTEEIIPPVYANKMSLDSPKYTTENGVQYAEYNVSYLEFSAKMKVQIVNTDIHYPEEVIAEYVGSGIKKGESPDLNDLEIKIRYNDCIYEEKDLPESAKFYMLLYYDNITEYEYKLVCDYTFQDEAGNTVYACTFGTVFVPYE